MSWIKRIFHKAVNSCFTALNAFMDLAYKFLKKTSNLFCLWYSLD